MVTALFQDVDDDVRYYATQSLKSLGGTGTVDALMAALKGDPSPAAKRYSAEIFATLGDPHPVDVLRGLAQDDDVEVQETAVWALKILGVD